MFKRYSLYVPSLGQSWLLVLIFMLAGTLFSSIIVFPLMKLIPNNEFISKALQYLLLFIPILIYINIKAKTIERDSILSGIEAKRVPISNTNLGRMNPILFFFIVFIATVALGMIIDPISNAMPTPEWFNRIMETTVGGNIWISLLTVSIFAPLFEEFLCRGIILRGLLEHIAPWKAILWSAFIFAIIHLNPWQAVPAFILGVFMGWIYYKTRSLWATIFCHFVNNTISTLIFQFIPDASIDLSFRDIVPDAGQYWALFSIAIGIIALTIFIFTKYITPKKNEKVISA